MTLYYYGNLCRERSDSHGAEYWSRYDDRRGLLRVEASREHLVIGKHLDAAVEEVADEILAHRNVGIPIDGRRWDA